MIDKSTLSFLKGLSDNNSREWFNSHKAEYENARENALDFTAKLISKLSAFDNTIPADLNPKDCVMRIYRDIRFSNDKTPYKTNFGIAISSNGKNFKGPGYYLHLQPGSSFVAAGSWYPEAAELKSIRQEIDYNGQYFKSILKAREFVDAFGDLDRESSLKTVPKGYSADNDSIEYLKLKSFTASSPISDKDLLAKNSAEIVSKLFHDVHPLMLFLRNSIS